MRVIGGTWRSRVIDAPDEGLRPTAGRVREAVFNILANVIDWEECTVCDLFAGSGALGIEALSRGARHATFVERHAMTTAIIARNLHALGAVARATLITGDALSYACGAGAAADVVFADPPYHYDERDALLACVFARPLFTRAFVYEHATDEALPQTPAAWKSRTFGASSVTIYLREDQ